MSTYFRPPVSEKTKAVGIFPPQYLMFELGVIILLWLIWDELKKS
jgi:hypothetical protein